MPVTAPSPSSTTGLPELGPGASAAGTELARKAFAELLGSMLLAATVVGSGIAAQSLSPADTGLELLENALVTGAVLVALVLALGPVSAAFNPVVTFAECASARSAPSRPRRWSSRRSPAAASVWSWPT